MFIKNGDPKPIEPLFNLPQEEKEKTAQKLEDLKSDLDSNKSKDEDGI